MYSVFYRTVVILLILCTKAFVLQILNLLRISKYSFSIAVTRGHCWNTILTPPPTENASPATLPYRRRVCAFFLPGAVIWLNEKTEDFALYGELEKAFFRNHRKLDVSCIVERDLYGAQLASNPNLREAAPEFKIGTLAAIAGLSFLLCLFSLVFLFVFSRPLALSSL